MAQPAGPRFPGLDELRAVAAVGIVVLHVEEFRGHLGYGGFAAQVVSLRVMVTFFFVLSGFLITHLLLAERAISGTVAVVPFLQRRAVRIWPLYYLVAVAGLLVMPHIPALAVSPLTAKVGDHLAVKLALFAVLLPNAAFALYPPVPYAAHAWSIGVEEQFYLLWPLLMRFARHPLPWMLAVVVLAAGGRIAAEAADPEGAWTIFLRVTRVGCMAVGGVAAWALFHRRRLTLAVLFHPLTQVATAGGLVWVSVAPGGIPFVAHEAQAVLFAVVVVNAAANPRTLFRLRAGWLAAVGRWSYGVYMLHPLVVGVVLWVFGKVVGLDLRGLPGGLALHAAAIGLTVGVSALSFRFFETPFLRLKWYPRRPSPAAPLPRTDPPA